MDKKFQQVTIIIASDDHYQPTVGGKLSPLDILCDLIVDTTDVDLISITDTKDMQLVVKED